MALTTSALATRFTHDTVIPYPLKPIKSSVSKYFFSDFYISFEPPNEGEQKFAWILKTIASSTGNSKFTTLLVKCKKNH
jgi:hypothetical protein